MPKRGNISREEFSALVEFLEREFGLSIQGADAPDLRELQVAYCRKTGRTRSGVDFYQICLQPKKEHGKVSYRLTKARPGNPVETCGEYLSILCSEPGELMPNGYHKVHLRHAYREPEDR